MAKIAIINFYQGISNRGGEVFVEEIAKRLSEKNKVYVYEAGSNSSNVYNTVCFQTKYDPNNSDKKLSTGNLLKRLFLDYDSRKIFLFTIKIIPNLIKLKPQVIYPLNSGWQVLILKIISLFTNSKLIVAGHSGPGWNDRVNLFTKPEIFIALTQTQAEWAKKASLWRSQKIVVVPNGVDTTKFNPVGDKLQLKLKKPIFLCVAAAITSKRVEETIRAVSLLKNTSLLVVGTGPNEMAEDKLGEKLLGDKYKRIKVKISEMPKVYRSCDVFTLCSDSSEAFGIVYLEALATGLNCVVTDDKNRREILSKSGFYVTNPLDSKEYSKILQNALEKKQLNTNIFQAKKFSWDEVIKEYEMIINNLTN